MLFAVENWKNLIEFCDSNDVFTTSESAWDSNFHIFLSKKFRGNISKFIELNWKFRVQILCADSIKNIKINIPGLIHISLAFSLLIKLSP
jgi:hypothetical protein